MKPLFLLAFFILAYGRYVFPQDSTIDRCEVLLKTIDEFYDGGCKNGLAHGNGFASGMDKYKGKFKKGLPHGWGTYTWKNGNTYEGRWKKGKMDGKGTFIQVREGEKDSITQGYWQDGKFLEPLRNRNLKGYEVTSTRNIESVYIYRAGIGRDIHIILERGNVYAPIRIVTLIGSTGVTNPGGREGLGFEEVKFPFTGHVSFTATNIFGLGLRRCEVDFRIEKEGEYYIEINY